MSRAGWWRACGAVVASLALGACDERLASVSIVAGPRVLAIVAEPPEARPGETVNVRVVLGGFAAAPTLRATVCARPEETSSALPISSYGELQVDRGCASEGAVPVAVVTSSDAARPPRDVFTVPPDVLTRLDVLRAAFGAGLSEGELARLARVAGVPLVYTVEALDPASGRLLLRALKRVRVLGDPARAPNTNPPPPRFTFGDVMYGPARDGERCEPQGQAAQPATAPRAQVRLVPAAGEEAWLEAYTDLDTEGQPVPRVEQAYYAVYSDAGAWDLGRARMPDREPRWTAPDGPSGRRVSHWFVVRDGRGGTAACAFESVVQ